MAKQFNDFTYGVGLTMNASSFKQVKDDLKINLDTLKKMVKNYSEMLKLDPNADLSKLFTQLQETKSLIDAMSGSNNVFGDFVDKGVLDRVAALEDKLLSITSTSDTVKASLSELKSDIATLMEPLKNAGQSKFPATFDNLFGDFKDQSAQIKNITNVIHSLESAIPQLQNLWEELGHTTANKNWNADDISDWVARIEDIKDALSNASTLEPGQLSNFTVELDNIGRQLGSAIKSMSGDQLKSFQLNDEYVFNEIQDCIDMIKNQKAQLETELQSLNELQEKYISKQVSRDKSLGVQSDYAAQVKVTPKANDVEWTNKINDTIKNIEPLLSPVKLRATFAKGNNVQQELEGNVAQINQTVGLELKVSGNMKQFDAQIQNIGNHIRSAKQQLEKEGNFKIRFEYEESGRFQDAAYKIINKFKRIETKFYIANGSKFIKDVTGLKNKAQTKVKNIPATIVMNKEKQDAFLSQLDTVRAAIDKKIGSIGVSLHINNVPQLAAEAAMLRDGIESFYNNNPIGNVADPNTTGIDTVTNDMQELSDAAKKANEDLEKSKNILASLTNEGFDSAHFLELGDINSKGKKVKGSTKKLEKLLQEYRQLKKLLPSGDVFMEDWFKLYPEAEGNESLLGALVGANRSRLQELEEELNGYLQKQIAYTQQRQEAAEALLQTEKAITTTQQSDKRSQSQESVQGNQQLAMSAEQANKQVRSLAGTLSWQKRVLNDLNKNGIKSSNFIKLGKWDEETNSFTKNAQEIQTLVQRYNELRDARLKAGVKAPGKEELSIKGQLVAILRSQKQHIQEIIAANQAELDAAKEVANAYKQSGGAKSQAVKNTSAQIDELTTKLDKAKAALQQLQSGDLSAIGKTGLGDVSGRLEEVGSTQKLQQVLQLYSNLIAAKNEWINSGGKGEFKYAQQLEIVEQQLQQIHHDQLQYTQNRLAALEEEIRKEKEKLQIQDQSKSANTQQSTSSGGQIASSVVKLDGATLNSLAKDATLQTISGKIDNVLNQLGNINIDGSNISINANNVSVSGKGASTRTNTGGTKRDSGQNDIKLSTLSNLSQQLTAFEERIKRSGMYTDELYKKFVELRAQLDAMKVQDDAELYKIDLNTFKESFEQLKTFDQLYQNFIDSQTKLQHIQYKIDNSDGSTQELREKLKEEQAIAIAIEEQLVKYTEMFDIRARQLAIEEAIKRATVENAKYDASKNDSTINKQNTNIAKIVDDAQQKLLAMQNIMSNSKVPMADAAIAKFQQYKQLLADLQAKQQEVAANPSLLQNEDYAKGFKTLLLNMKQVQQEFGSLQKSSETFLSKIADPDKDLRLLGPTFKPSDLAQLHTAMQEFANQAGNGTAKLVEFNDVSRVGTFEIRNNKGQVELLTVEYDEATNALGRYVNKTRESTSETQKFISSIKHSFQNVARYIASFGSVYRIFAVIKQGITYVKEIDSALTELKKVTDEADASYDKFLQDMSKTAGTVGSTVKDLTTMSAEWARLKYLGLLYGDI